MKDLLKRIQCRLVLIDGVLAQTGSPSNPRALLFTRCNMVWRETPRARVA